MELFTYAGHEPLEEYHPTRGIHIIPPSECMHDQCCLQSKRALSVCYGIMSTGRDNTQPILLRNRSHFQALMQYLDRTSDGDLAKVPIVIVRRPCYRAVEYYDMSCALMERATCFKSFEFIDLTLDTGAQVGAGFKVIGLAGIPMSADCCSVYRVCLQQGVATAVELFPDDQGNLVLTKMGKVQSLRITAEGRQGMLKCFHFNRLTRVMMDVAESHRYLSVDCGMLFDDDDLTSLHFKKGSVQASSSTVNIPTPPNTSTSAANGSAVSIVKRETRAPGGAVQKNSSSTFDNPNTPKPVVPTATPAVARPGPTVYQVDQPSPSINSDHSTRSRGFETVLEPSTSASSEYKRRNFIDIFKSRRRRGAMSLVDRESETGSMIHPIDNGSLDDVQRPKDMDAYMMCLNTKRRWQELELGMGFFEHQPSEGLNLVVVDQLATLTLRLCSILHEEFNLYQHQRSIDKLQLVLYPKPDDGDYSDAAVAGSVAKFLMRLARQQVRPKKTLVCVPSDHTIVVIKDMLHHELQFREREGLNLVAMVGDITQFEQLRD